MGDLDDHKVRDAIMESMEEVMMEEIQTLRVGLEDWKRVAQEWATENLVTTKKLVEAEVEVATLRAEVERLRGLLRDSCDLTDEALGHAPDYFKVKWGMPEAADRIRREGGLTDE